jgi:type II secretory pathway component PulF
MSSDEANKLMERKRKLDDELQGKLSTELSEMIKKSNAYVKETQESNRRYWEQQFKQELDSMEKDLTSGNTMSAMTHKIAADNYQRLLHFSEF